MGNGRAYVRLKVSRDMSALKQYVESSDHEIFKKSSVSFAPCQRVRSDVGKVNPLEGTLQDFEDFTIFCAHLKEGTSYGQHVEIIDKKESGELGSTALMAFLEKQHKGKGIKKPARKSTQKSNQKPKVQADQQQKSDRGNQKDELNRIDGDKKSIKAPRVKKKGPNSKKKIAPPPGAMVPPDRPEPAMGNRPSEGASIDNQVNSNKIKRDKKKNPPKPSIKDPEATARGGKSSRGRGRGKGRGRGTGSQQIAILTRAAADVTS